jgi:hypothetical protein
MTQGICGCLAIQSESSSKNMILSKANIPEKSPVFADNNQYGFVIVFLLQIND